MSLWPGQLAAGDRLRLATVGALTVADVTTNGTRTARHRGSSADCKIDVLITGHGIVEQDGRAAHLRAGDLALVDLSRPARWAMASMRMVAVAFPRPLLPLPPDGLTGVRIAGDRGAGALVSALAGRLMAHVEDCGPAEGARLGSALLDLVTIALVSHEPPETRPPMLDRIYAYIEQRLDDPELTPRVIAAAHFISLRYLHKLFEAEPTGVAGWNPPPAAGALPARPARSGAP